MLESGFRDYLRNVRGLSARTISSRISSCRRVERYEGNLDQHFDNDQCHNLLWRLTYSAEDHNQQRPPKHNIPIGGNLRTGSAILKRAVSLYVQFRGSDSTLSKVEGVTPPPVTSSPPLRFPRTRGGREANPHMSGKGCLIIALWAIIAIASLILVTLF